MNNVLMIDGGGDGETVVCWYQLTVGLVDHMDRVIPKNRAVMYVTVMACG